MNDPSAEEPKRRTGFLARIRAYFLAGVLVTAPVAITLAVAFWVINFVDSHIVPLIPLQWNPDTYLREQYGIEFGIPGLGVIVLFIVITLIGWVTASYLGHFLVRTGETIVARMPVIRSIYGAVKQIIDTIFRDQSKAFRQAVLVEYPRRGLWTIAFITGTTEGEIQHRMEEDLVTVYVPTTPNPTSGFVLFLPREDVVELDMSVEEAFKVVISGGIVTPKDKRPEAEQDAERISARRSEMPVNQEPPRPAARVANLIED